MSLCPLGGRLDLSAHDPINPDGAGSNCLPTMTNSPELPVPSGSEASGLSEVYVVVDSSSWGYGSSGCLVFFVGFRDVMGFSSVTSNMDILSRPFVSMRYIKHLQRSCMAQQSLPGGGPDSMAHLWRAQANATISSHLTTLISLQP